MAVRANTKRLFMALPNMELLLASRTLQDGDGMLRVFIMLSKNTIVLGHGKFKEGFVMPGWLFMLLPKNLMLLDPSIL